MRVLAKPFPSLSSWDIERSCGSRPCSLSRAVSVQCYLLTRKASSGADEARVETACDTHVRGSLYDGPAVGKERQMIFGHGHTQCKLVHANFAERAQPRRELFQVDRPSAVMQLNSISSTETHRCLALPIQKAKFACCADPAF